MSPESVSLHTCILNDSTLQYVKSLNISRVPLGINNWISYTAVCSRTETSLIKINKLYLTKYFIQF